MCNNDQLQTSVRELAERKSTVAVLRALDFEALDGFEALSVFWRSTRSLGHAGLKLSQLELAWVAHSVPADRFM